MILQKNWLRLRKQANLLNAMQNGSGAKIVKKAEQKSKRISNLMQAKLEKLLPILAHTQIITT